MEEEDEEARALLGDRPEGESAVRGAPRALPALCDPSHLAHRLVVLLLMCFLGFGEPGRAREDDRGIPGFESPDPLCRPGVGPPLSSGRERGLGTELATSQSAAVSSLGTGVSWNLSCLPRSTVPRRLLSVVQIPLHSLPQATSPHPTPPHRARFLVFLELSHRLWVHCTLLAA